MVDKPEKVTSRLACKGELVQAPESSEGNLKPYPEEGTASVAREGEPPKSGYLTFDPGGMSTINWIYFIIAFGLATLPTVTTPTRENG